MTNEEYGEVSAFAAVAIGSNGNNYIQYGLGIRHYFAAAAMQGMLSNLNRSTDPKYVAISAVQYAEALINELNKTDDKI